MATLRAGDLRRILTPDVPDEAPVLVGRTLKSGAVKFDGVSNHTVALLDPDVPDAPWQDLTGEGSGMDDEEFAAFSARAERYLVLWV